MMEEIRFSETFVFRLLITANVVTSSVILFGGMMEAIRSSETSVLQLLFTANVPSSLILFTLMMEANIHQIRWFLQEPHGVTSLKTAFFIAIALKTSGLT
jgi:hypothetical protein